MTDSSDKKPRPLPRPTPETQHFWDGTKAGELRLQQCRDCSSIYFPPRPFCPECASNTFTKPQRRNATREAPRP